MKVPVAIFCLGVGACTGRLTAGGVADGTDEPGSVVTGGQGGAGGDGVRQGTGGTPSSDPCAPQPVRLWKLSPAQYTNTVRAALGTDHAALRPGDELIATLAPRTEATPGAGALEMTAPHVKQLRNVAGELATRVLADAALFPCRATPAAPACLADFVDSLGARLFRRPVTDAERSSYVNFVTRHAGDMGALRAAELMVTAMFLSPSFLFRTELGPEAPAPGITVELTPFEWASAISYLLSDGPPDAALYEAARDGTLSAPDARGRHARRLLGTADTGRGLVRFLVEHFGTARAGRVVKDEAVYPSWRHELQTALVTESELFLEQVLWNADARFATLLAADFSMVDARLANYYRLPDRDAFTDFARATLPATRAGLLTHGGLQASLARENDTDPVARGRYMRETILCTTPPSPPPTVNATPIPPDGQRTQRERLAQHSADPTCKGCHELMDPIGLAFEAYDGVGRYRKTDVGKTIDTTGILTGVGAAEVAFADAPALARLLSGAPEALGCFALRAFEFGQGRHVEDADACAVDAVTQEFLRSEGNIIDLMVTLGTHERFGRRRAP